jgi:predicted RNase H-like HicB family nuclease
MTVQGEKQIIGFKIEVIVEPDDNGFHAYCPTLKGLHTFGESEEEAVANARDAATAYLESCIKHHDSIPLGITMYNESSKVRDGNATKAVHHMEDLQVACNV